MLSFPAVRAELVEAVFPSRVAGLPTSRGLPGGNSLSFASPKESKQRKGDPMVRVLPLRSRQPAVLGKSGVLLELASLRQSQALIRFYLRSSARPDGWGKRMRMRGGEDALCASSPESDPAPVPVSVPVFPTLLYAPRSAGPDGSGRAIV